MPLLKMTHPVAPKENAGRSAKIIHTLIGISLCLFLVVLIAGMIIIYERTRYMVTLHLDDRVEHVHTHQLTVSGLLRELGLSLAPEDILAPGEDAPLAPGDTVIIRHARPVWIEADGRALLHKTHCQTVGALLQEVGMAVQKNSDRLFLNEQEVSVDSPLPITRWSDQGRTVPLLRVERAVPVVLHDGGIATELHTAAKLVGEALWQAGLTVYLGDTVQPALDTPISAGMHIYLWRSQPVTIATDGQIIRTRTQGKTVADALAQEGIHLGGKDYVQPPPDTPIADGLHIRAVHVAEEWFTESEIIPHETVWQMDEGLEIDDQRISERGQDGLRKRRFRIRYEDGQETARLLEKEWIAQEAQTRVILYGTKIILREIETPEGIKRYWRHIRALATSYTAATSGKSPDDRFYGITYMGWQARKGIIAVDPSVIPLTTNVYVPGYGLAVAGDTGGKIKGRRIDLCYDEDNLILWYKWVDVYLLEPVPPKHKIAWLLPNWPRER